jgi:hypothetical protein
MSIERRLKKLEGGVSDANSEWVTPIEVLVHCKAVERHQALRDGKEPPAYSREEVAALREWDIETVAGEGFEAQMRENAGWQTEEGQALLDLWEQEARRRLKAAEGLPPERWPEVWTEDEDEGAVT